MKKKAISFACLTIIVAFVISSFSLESFKSAGAPMGKTNAPLEETCAEVGCHDDGVVNGGPGTLDVNFSNSSNLYAPGKTYTLTVTINQTGISKFGFEALALVDADSSNAGRIKLLNGLTTQVMSPDDSSEITYGRRYITHTIEGNQATAPNERKWQFLWDAPAVDMGAISFYVASLAGNNSADETGDDVYLSTLAINPDPSPGIEDRTNLPRVSLFPNPASGRIYLSFGQSTGKSGRIELFGIGGSKVLSYVIHSGKTQNINVTGLGGGTYIYRILIENDLVKEGKLVIY